MAAVFFLLFITRFSPVLPHVLEQNRESHKNCHPFECAKLGEIKYPFTNTAIPTMCGAFLVDGCSESHERIQLENGTGRWYDAENISQADTTYTIYFTDKEFKKGLPSKSCEVSYASFQFFPNLTLYKCNDVIDLDAASFHTSSLISCVGCSIYYAGKNRRLANLSSNCSLLEHPRQMDDNNPDILHGLRAKYFLKVHFNDSNYQYTLTTQNNCPTHEASKGNKNFVRKLLLALAIGCPAIALIFLLIVVIRHRNSKKCPSPDFSLANSPEPTLSLDLECIDCLGVRIFSYAELEAATNNFDRENELGDGGFGTAYYGQLRDGREVAVKRLHENNHKRVKQFLNEIEILTRISHANLVKLYGCTTLQSRNLVLVYEYVPNGNVADRLYGCRKKSETLTWPTRIRIAVETATALAHLHASNIIHRDVTTRNILLDENYCVKVADFGLSRLSPKEMSHISTTPQGSPGYVDPDYYYCCKLTDKSDVYSFGVVLVELISSLRAIDTTRHQDEINLANFALNKIQKCEFDELIDPRLGYKTNEEIHRMTTSVAELAFLCLQQDKEMRPSMDEVLKQLKIIESWGKHVGFDASQNAEGPISRRDCDEDALLKNTRLPPSSSNSGAAKSSYLNLCALRTNKV